MSKTIKLLFGALILLILIAGGELALYFNSTNRPSSKAVTGSTAQIPTLMPQVKPTAVIPTVNSQVTQGATKQSKVDYQDVFNLNADLVKKLGKDANYNVLKSFVITMEFQSSVASLIRKNITISPMVGNRPLVFSVELKLKLNQQEDHTILFGENDIKKLKVSSVDKNQKVSLITIDDIKAGDKIIMILTSDLMKNPNESLISGTIQKLE